MTSIYKIAEECKNILKKGIVQEYIPAVINAYGTVVRNAWYENKQDDISEVDGVFVYTFKGLEPIFDASTDMYYIAVPSSYLRLPNEMGINYVGFAKGQAKPFVRIGSGSLGLWNNIKANVFGGSQTYMSEGNKMYFPKMTNLTNGNIMLKLAIALDTANVREDLIIPPNIVDSIVTLVVQKYSVKVQEKPENLN